MFLACSSDVPRYFFGDAVAESLLFERYWRNSSWSHEASNLRDKSCLICRDEVALRMLRWRSTHVPRKSLSNSRIDIYIYNIGRDFAEVEVSGSRSRNTPGIFLGLLQRYINPRFSPIKCAPKTSASNRLCASVRNTTICDLRGALSRNFELCQTLRSTVLLWMERGDFVAEHAPAGCF